MRLYTGPISSFGLKVEIAIAEKASPTRAGTLHASRALPAQTPRGRADQPQAAGPVLVEQRLGAVRLHADIRIPRRHCTQPGAMAGRSTRMGAINVSKCLRTWVSSRRRR